MNKTNFVFQTDSDVVKNVYETQDNFLIEYDEQCLDKQYCAVYFSSNDIYYPNTEEIFRKRIVDKNFFEWYHSRITKVYKHIFLRDVFKQWYLKGVNSVIDSPTSLVAWLRKETKGYKIIMIGSSAGGYASILYGSILGVEKILAFNPQFELNSLLQRSSKEKNPLVFSLSESDEKIFYDIVPFIHGRSNIYYFYSNKSKWDITQAKHLGNNSFVNIVPFKSKHHGIPFLKIALPSVLNLNECDLNSFVNVPQNPFVFSVKIVGLLKTISGCLSQSLYVLKKKYLQ